MIVHRDERRGRAESFAGVADAYERGRPEYPLEAVAWLTGESPLHVVDLGAGTGKLTRGLLALGHRVTAVEPLPEMLVHLRAAAPEAVPLAGSAEQTSLPDESADVVVAAQAFHWFDHAVAMPEIARILRPGGRLALVWNTRDDRDPWVARLSDTIMGRETVQDSDALEPLAQSRLFGPVETATFSFAQVLQREPLRDLVVSRSYCAILGPEEREQVLDRVDALYDQYAGPEGIRIPYLTECFRAPKL
jgi:SAM-dependent methyltransferase